MQETAIMMATVIAAHHGMLDFNCISDLKQILTAEGKQYDLDGNTISLPNLMAIKQSLKIFSAEINLPRLSSSLAETSSLAKMLCTRFLLSALADADYSASAEHFDSKYLLTHTGKTLIPGQALENIANIRLEKQNQSTASAKLNHLRNTLYDDCIKAAEMSPGIFTLTAPTGLGKTISLFAFAAKHCELHKKRRIILVLHIGIINQISDL
jgi:CRISPR-associated endonuclease/helicase Cas3